MTVAGAIEHWLDNRKPEVRPVTWETYHRISRNNVVGPLLIGTPAARGYYRPIGRAGSSSMALEIDSRVWARLVAPFRVPSGTVLTSL